MKLRIGLKLLQILFQSAGLRHLKIAQESRFATAHLLNDEYIPIFQCAQCYLGPDYGKSI